MEQITLREVKWHPKTNRICQIPKEGLEFAMLSSGYEQLNQLVWCKDFMQDLIWSYVNNQSIDIYGFSYDPRFSPAPSLRRLRMLVTNYKDPDFGNKIKNNVLPLLHSVELRLKMSKTILEKCKNNPATYKKSGVWILDSSKRWLKSPPMLSFFTLLVRIGLVHNPEDSLETTLAKIESGQLKSYYDAQCRDKEMITKALPGIKKILKYSDRKIFPSKISLNYPSHYKDVNSKNAFSKLTIFNIHDRCGLVGFSCGTTKQYFPEWVH